MPKRFTIPCLLAMTLAFVRASPAALTEAERNLLTEVSKRAAYVQAWVDLCAGGAPETNAANEQALREWQTRNHWETIQGAFRDQPKFAPAFEQARAQYVANLKEKSAAGNCKYAAALMRRTEFDPSVATSGELQQLAAKLKGGPTATEQPPPPATVTPAPPAAPEAAEASPSLAPTDDEEQPAAEAKSPGSATSPQPAAPTPSRATGGGQISAGEVSFSIPSGWTLQKSSATSAFLQHVDDRDERTSLAIAAEPLAGPLAAAARTWVLQALRDASIKIDPIREVKSPYGYDAVFFNETVRHPQTRKRIRFTGVAFAVNGRMQTALLFASDTVGYYKREREMEELVKSWRFLKGPAEPVWDPLRPPKGSGGLEGLYWGTTLRNEINPLGGMDLKAVRNHLLLLRNGWAYRDVPPGGRVYDFNPADAIKSKPRDCGVYSVQGDQLTLDWITSYGLIEREQVPFKRVSGDQLDFEWEGTSMRKLKPVGNIRVSGKFTSTFYMSGMPGAPNNTSVTSGSSIAFTQDGRYEKSGFSAFSFAHEGGDSTVRGVGKSDRTPKSGTYVLEGFKLSLKQNDGQVETFTCLIEDPTDIGALFLDDKAFLKK